MTVRQLITILANYPPDANVSMMPHGGDVIVQDARHGGDPARDALLYVDATKLEEGSENRYRRGALDQLFSSESTGLDDPKAVCEHGVQLHKRCTECWQAGRAAERARFAVNFAAGLPARVDVVRWANEVSTGEMWVTNPGPVLALDPSRDSITTWLAWNITEMGTDEAHRTIDAISTEEEAWEELAWTLRAHAPSK